MTCSGAKPKLSSDVVPLFAKSCAKSELCHGGFADAADAFDGLVNVPASRDTCRAATLVVPGAPEASYLVNKLTGQGMCPKTDRMPVGGSLSSTEIQTVVDWICAGALNN